MESVIKQLVKSGHELAAQLGNQLGMNDTASLVQRLTAQLDITAAALREMTKKRDALAAENAGLKEGASYFSYGSEHNFEWHKTAEEAVEAAEAAIDDYRGDACDGWSEEVDSVCWGIIMQSSTKVGERPRNDEDRCDPAIDTICDYALLPNIKTPATDAFLAEVRAQGVEMFAAHKRERQQALRRRSMRMSEEAAGMAADAENFADELRKGVQS